MEDVINRYNLWNQQLKEKYYGLFPNAHYTIWDGVIFPELYAKSPLKILFLNREPYDNEMAQYQEYDEYNLSVVLKNAIENNNDIFVRQNALRTHVKQYLGVLNTLLDSKLNSLSDEQMNVHIENFIIGNENFYEMMKSVAYCNIKKSDGKPRSSTYDLHNYASKGIDILKNQISYFNPSLILGGNVVDGILENIGDIWDQTALYIPEGERRICIWQLKVGEKLIPFVDMHHPSAVKGMSDYYLELFHALKEVERTHPGYWETRLNMPCFINAH